MSSWKALVTQWQRVSTPIFSTPQNATKMTQDPSESEIEIEKNALNRTTINDYPRLIGHLSGRRRAKRMCVLSGWVTRISHSMEKNGKVAKSPSYDRKNNCHLGQEKDDLEKTRVVRYWRPDWSSEASRLDRLNKSVKRETHTRTHWAVICVWCVCECVRAPGQKEVRERERTAKNKKAKEKNTHTHGCW